MVILDDEFESVQIGDGLGHTKAEPVAALVPAVAAAIEPAEDLVAFLGDAATGVADANEWLAIA